MRLQYQLVVVFSVVFIFSWLLLYSAKRTAKRIKQMHNDPFKDYITHSLLHDHHYSDAFDLALRVKMMRDAPDGSGVKDYLFRRHFSWLPVRNLDRLKQTVWTDKRGIVICTGDTYFRLTVHLIGGRCGESTFPGGT